MVLSSALDKFLQYQRLKRNSPATIADYTICIKKFIEWCGDPNCRALTADMVNDYNLYLHDRVKPVTVRTYIRHIRVFVHFCVKNKYCKDIYNGIIMPKRSVKVVDILTPADIRLLMDSFGNNYHDIRNKCMIIIMLDCGLRASEVVGLLINNIDFQYNYLKVCGKGDKERIVPFGRSVLETIRSYQQIRPRCSCPRLFVDVFGSPLQRTVFKKIFKRLRDKTGIKRLHPHLLRHTFATNYLLYSDGDIYKLSMLLGHSDVTTSEIYLHYANYYSFMKTKKSFSFLDSFNDETP